MTEETGELPPPPTCRILVGEKEEALSRRLEAVLDRSRYQVQRVENGYRLIEIALAGGADVILLDLDLPVVDGLEVTQILRGSSRTGEIPIGLVSDRSDLVQVASVYPGVVGLKASWSFSELTEALAGLGVTV